MSDLSRNEIVDDPFADFKEEEELSLYGLPVYTTYLRVLGLCVLCLSLVFWAKGLGLIGPDLMDQFIANNHKGIVEGCLLVVLTVLCVGLWLGTSWGYFLWFLASFGVLFAHFSIEAVSYLQYSVASSLAILLLVYIALHLVNFVATQAWLTEKNTD